MKATMAALADIHVPEDRLRPVKADFASFYASVIGQGWELPPVQVRATPNGKLKLTLVSGAHRVEAHRIAGRTEIAVQLVKADAEQARMMEVAENLFRNQFTALEQVLAIAEYRRIWEAAFGEIKRGRPRKNGQNVRINPDDLPDIETLNLLGVSDGSEQGSFYSKLTERLGITARHCKRYSNIAGRLRPELRDALFGTDAEDNLSWIDSLSSETPEDQALLARAIREQTGGDVAAAERLIWPNRLENQIKPDKAAKARNALESSWGRMKRDWKKRWVREARDEIEGLLAEIDAEDGHER